jgi:hypothetical protein
MDGELSRIDPFVRPFQLPAENSHAFCFLLFAFDMHRGEIGMQNWGLVMLSAYRAPP